MQYSIVNLSRYLFTSYIHSLNYSHSLCVLFVFHFFLMLLNPSTYVLFRFGNFPHQLSPSVFRRWNNVVIPLPSWSPTMCSPQVTNFGAFIRWSLVWLPPSVPPRRRPWHRNRRIRCLPVSQWLGDQEYVLCHWMMRPRMTNFQNEWCFVFVLRCLFFFQS